MKLINQIALARGHILVDYAFSGPNRNMDLEAADLIGVVAAYVARGQHGPDIGERLGELLGRDIGLKAERTFEMFEDWDGRGLWIQGPAVEHTEFTHPKLDAYYPEVNERWKAMATGPVPIRSDQTF